MPPPRGVKPPQLNGGSRKGCPNRTTAAIKEAILEAFERGGGVDYLVAVMQSDPQTFCTLLGKVVPREVAAELTGSGGGPIVVATGVPRPRP